MSEGARRIARTLVPLLVSGLLLAALTLVFDPHAALTRLSELSPQAVALACLALMVCFSIGAFRFERAARRASGTAHSLIARIVPLSLFTILLAHGLSLASEAVRMHFLVRRLKVGWRLAGFVAIADRAFGLGASVVLAGLSLAVFPGVADPLRLAGLGLGLTGLTVLAVIASGAPVPSIATRLGFTRERMSLFAGSYGDGLFQLAIATAGCVALGLAIHVLAADLRTPLPVWVSLLAAPLIYAGISVPFTFAGWGAREAMHVLVFAATGLMDVDHAVALSLALGACFFAASLPGLVWLLIDSGARDAVGIAPPAEELGDDEPSAVVNPQKAHYERIHEAYEAHYYDPTSLEYRRRFIFGPLLAGADLSGKKVADLACGSGFNSVLLREMFPTVEVVGFDISEKACAAYAEVVGAPAHCLDLTLDTDVDGSFDAAIVVGGLHHCVADLAATVRNVARLLKPGGVFYYYEPNDRFVLQWARDVWYRVDRFFDADTERALSHGELRALGGPLFEPALAIHVGGPAYFLILNSLVMRVPLALKKPLTFGLFAIEGGWNRMSAKLGPGPCAAIAGSWRRTQAAV